MPSSPKPRRLTRDQLNKLVNWLTDEQGFYKFERIIKEARANPTKYRTAPKYRVRKADGLIRKPSVTRSVGDRRNQRNKKANSEGRDGKEA